MLPRRKSVAGIAVLGAVVLLGPAAARGAAPDTTASRVPVTISATSLSVDQLVYVGTVPVSTAAGPVSTLELDIVGARFEGLTLALPCVPVQLGGGLTGRTTTAGTTTADRLTVYATDVVATIGGTQVRLSSTDPAYPPPPAGTVLVSNGTVAEPTIVAVLAVSAALTAPSLTTSARFCTPGAATPLTGIPLVGLPKPGAPAASGGAGPAAPSTVGGPGGSSGHDEPPAPPTDTSTSLPSPPPSGDATTSPAPSPDPATAPVPEPSPTP